MKRVLTVLTSIALFLFVVGSAVGSGAQQAPVAARPATGPLDPYSPPLTVTTWRTDPNRAYPAGQSLTDNVWTRAIEEKLGIRFEYAWTTPSGELGAKINTSIAAGDLPDLMNKLNLSQYDNLARAGRLAPMSAHIERYDIGEVGAFLDLGGGLARNILTVGGDIYGWGNMAEMSALDIFVARSDWLENVGRNPPDTVEEIIDVLYAFTNEDPNRSGSRDTYGLAVTRDFLSSALPLDTFFALHKSYPNLWMERDGGLVHGSLLPETRQVLGVLRQLQADGVLSPEWPVLNDNAVSDEMTRGKAGAAFARRWFHGWGPTIPTIMANPGLVWEHTYARNVDGERYSVPRPAVVSSINAMNSRFPNPEALVKLHNLYYQEYVDHTTAQMQYRQMPDATGRIIATHHFWNDFFTSPLINQNPQHYRNVVAALDGRIDPTSMHATAREGYLASVEYLKDPTALEGQGYRHYRQYGHGSVYELAWIMLDENRFQFDAYQGPPTQTQGRLGGDLLSTRDEIFVQIIIGERDLNGGWDAWLNYWRNNGGTDWTSEVNAWYRENR